MKPNNTHARPYLSIVPGSEGADCGSTLEFEVPKQVSPARETARQDRPFPAITMVMGSSSVPVLRQESGYPPPDPPVQTPSLELDAVEQDWYDSTPQWPEDGEAEEDDPFAQQAPEEIWRLHQKMSRLTWLVGVLVAVLVLVMGGMGLVLFYW